MENRSCHHLFVFVIAAISAGEGKCRHASGHAGRLVRTDRLVDFCPFFRWFSQWSGDYGGHCCTCRVAGRAFALDAGRIVGRSNTDWTVVCLPVVQTVRGSCAGRDSAGRGREYRPLPRQNLPCPTRLPGNLSGLRQLGACAVTS